MGLGRWMRNLLSLVRKQTIDEMFDDELSQQYDEAKQAAMERVLGPMDEMVGHAIIPFAIGGAVDMYYFSKCMPGTVCATMELIQPNGKGPKPNRMGTYELVACTRLSKPVNCDNDAEDQEGKEDDDPFHRIERRICGIFTNLGGYSYEAKLKPGDTAETPGDEGQENHYLVLDEFDTKGVPFEINGRRHGLLLCMEVYASEMAYAREHGSDALFAKLKASGVYPYIDLDRPPVV